MGESVIGEEIAGHRYRIEEMLGRGGMGIVYKAEDLALSRSVAIKRLSPRAEDDESFMDRFHREARAIARINSPYIVEVYDITETEIGLVIVMEYVKGGTLKERIGPEGIEWEKAIPIIQQTLIALQHAHGAGVVHRDIKPRNILLDQIDLAHGLRVKMTDFGLAKVHGSGDPKRTVTQSVYGSLYYMSPEHVDGQVDRRSDVYSVGITCYEMLTGNLPFDENDSKYSIVSAIAEGNLGSLGASIPDVPGLLRKIIDKATARDPADRFQSAEEMRNAFEKLEGIPELSEAEAERTNIPADLDWSKESAGDAPTVTKERPDPAPESPSETTWTKKVGGPVMFVVLGMGIWYWYVSPLSSPPPSIPPVPVHETGIDSTDLIEVPPLDFEARLIVNAEPPEPEPPEPESPEPKPPDWIGQLLQIESTQRLRAQIDSLRSEGVIVRQGTEPADSENYYVFIETIAGPDAGTVEAVLSPIRDSRRIDLLSENNVQNWSDKYDSSRYRPLFVSGGRQ